MIADLIISLARNAARAYAADRDEPPWAEDTLSKAIFYEYQRLRSAQRAVELAEFEEQLSAS